MFFSFSALPWQIAYRFQRNMCLCIFHPKKGCFSESQILYFKVKGSKRQKMKYYSYSRLGPIAIPSNAFNYLLLVLPSVTAEVLKSIKQGLTMPTTFFTLVFTLARLCFFQSQVQSHNSPFSVSEIIPVLPQRNLWHKARSALKLCQFTQLRMHLSSGIHPFMMRTQASSLKCQQSPMCFLWFPWRQITYFVTKWGIKKKTTEKP